MRFFPILINVQKRNLGTFGKKPFGASAPYATSRTRHDCDFVPYSFHQDSPELLSITQGNPSSSRSIRKKQRFLRKVSADAANSAGRPGAAWLRWL